MDQKMRLLIIRCQLLLLLVYYVVGSVQFMIICRKNCDNSSQIDASKEIEVVADCVEDCDQSFRFMWELESKPKNVLQFLNREDVLGFNTSFLTIFANVLRCGEIYDLALYITHSKGVKVYVVEMCMAKCSRKYPAGEDEDETQRENDYSDFDYIDGSPEDLTLPNNEIWSKAMNAIRYMKTMYNKSNSFSIPKKKIEIMKLLELTKNASEYYFYNVIDEFVHLAYYGRDRLASVTRKTLQVGRTILRRAVDTKSYPHDLIDYDLFKDAVRNLSNTANYLFNINLEDLLDHRPKPTTLPEDDLDPQEGGIDYPDYKDYDLVYRTRKKIVEDIRFIQLDILKLVGMVQSRAGFNATEYMFWSKFGVVTAGADYIPPNITLPLNVLHFSDELVNETTSLLLNDTGVVLISLTDNFLWKRKSDCHFGAYYLSVGSRFDPFIFVNITNSFKWQFFYDFKSISRVEGYFRIPKDLTYDQISDDCLGIHQLFVELPMTAMTIKVEGVDAKDILKLVVLVGRAPKIVDFFRNDTIVFGNGTEQLTPTTVVPIKASPGANIFLALLPSEDTLNDMRTRRGNYLFYKYKLVLVRINCDYINEYTRRVVPQVCNVSGSLDNKTFCCFCTKTGLLQFSQVLLKSRFIEHIEQHQRNKSAPFNFIPVITLGTVVFLCFFAIVTKQCHRGSHLIVKRVQYLMDNNLLDVFGYFVVVSSGYSTTANVAFQLHGFMFSSPPHLFRGQSEPVLQSTADDWFYLLVDKDLGDLQSIDVWSDCYGFKSSWFCSRIKVINQTTNQEWIFYVNDWLSPIERKIFKTIKIENQEEVYYFQRHIYAIKSLANHLWIKTFSKLQTPIFTFMERMNIILLIFTTNMMFIMLALKYPDFLSIFWYFGYTEYKFTIYEMMSGCISGLTTFIITSLLIYFFTNSARCGANTELDNIRFTTRCRTISWVFMAFLLITGISVVIGFGLFSGFITSIVWIYTFLVGVFVCIILECFRVMIIGCFTRNVDPPKILTIDYKSIEIQRDKIMRGLGKSGMRPLLQKYYTTLSDDDIKVKEKFAQEIKILRFQKFDFLAYIIYILILFVIIIYNREPLSYISANNIRDIFVDDKYVGKIELAEINSQKRFYRYMQQVFLPSIHSTKWYGLYGSLSPGRLIDFNSKMIGVARIRQIRIENGTCKVPKYLKSFVVECHAEYSFFIQDFGNHGESWTPLNVSREKFKSDESWFYQNRYQTKALPFIGELAVYPGGGYTMTFGRTWSNSRTIFRYIKNTRWIDRRTRAIFLDVNFYNVNDNLFNFLTIAIEQSATGAFITNYQLHTLSFLFHQELKSKILAVLWSSLIVFIFVFSWNKYYEYKEFNTPNLKQYLQDFQNLIDFLIIGLLSCLLITLGVRFFIIENILKEMKLSNNEYISYSDIILCQTTIEITTAILITFSTIRLWKLLRFLRQFRLFELTLKFSTKYLRSMMVINILLILVYAGIGFLLLGPYVKEFRTVWSSFVALMLIAFGLEFNLGFETSHQTMYSYMGYIYFAGYLILVLVLLNIFITIIVVGYNNSKEYLDHQVPKSKVYNILDFLRDDWAYHRNKYRGRIRNVTIVNETNKAMGELRLRAGEDLLVRNIDTNSSKIISNAQSMLEIHQLADKAATLIQEKYRYNQKERHEDALRVLGHYYHRFSNEDQENPTLYDEYLVVTDEDQQNVYCSMKRQNDIKSIVEYLLNKKEPKSPQSIEETKKLLEKQISDVVNLRKISERMIDTLEKLLLEGCRNQSTQVTFEDLGLELSDASSMSEESSDDIEFEFLDGNIQISLNV